MIYKVIQSKQEELRSWEQSGTSQVVDCCHIQIQISSAHWDHSGPGISAENTWQTLNKWAEALKLPLGVTVTGSSHMTSIFDPYCVIMVGRHECEIKKQRRASASNLVHSTFMTMLLITEAFGTITPFSDSYKIGLDDSNPPIVKAVPKSAIAKVCLYQRDPWSFKYIVRIPVDNTKLRWCPELLPVVREWWGEGLCSECSRE